jgi:hypothetical protein
VSAVQSRSDKSKTGIGISGMDGESDGQSGMNANSEQGGMIAKRRLPGTLHAPSHTLPACDWQAKSG